MLEIRSLHPVQIDGALPYDVKDLHLLVNLQLVAVEDAQQPAV